MHTATSNPCTMAAHGQPTAAAACCRPDSPTFMNEAVKEAAAGRDKLAFWGDKAVWRRASKNTLNCLVGCSIGDFGALVIIQTWFPSTSIALTMIIAMASGLTTSVLLETFLLRRSEGFPWAQALRVAVGMSFISMVGMEFAENATDFLLTGGTVPTSDPWYWGALAISLIAGFIAPLPYNYFKLKKHGKSCH